MTIVFENFNYKLIFVISPNAYLFNVKNMNIVHSLRVLASPVIWPVRRPQLVNRNPENLSIQMIFSFPPYTSPFLHLIFSIIH